MSCYKRSRYQFTYENIRFFITGQSQPRSSRRNPWPRLLKYSKNRGVFCHVTHDEMAFSEVVSSVWRSYLFSCNLKPLFKENEEISSCFTRQNPDEILEASGSLGQGFHRPEKGPGDVVEVIRSSQVSTVMIALPLPLSLVNFLIASF